MGSAEPCNWMASCTLANAATTVVLRERTVCDILIVIIE